MIRIFSALLFVLILHLDASAGTAKAVVIGIDNYIDGSAPVNQTGGRGTWTNLDGAVNDAIGFKEVLIKRFRFDSKDILVLTDPPPTKKNILDAIKNHLLDPPAEEGDVRVFFYAGHGSQIKNSASSEGDRFDETIVPADANQATEQDVRDIRDKELRDLFNQIVGKGVTLTVILDSCHSGSATRGIGKARKLDVLPFDVKDPSNPPAPESNGALILSAAQDYQLAYEARDENQTPHGAFSLALITTLREANVDESAERIFSRVRAKMKTNGRTQEPVLAGTSERRKMPLFGGAISADAGKIRIPVIEQSGGQIILDGGSALGLAAGCELVKEDDKNIRIQISEVNGLARSKAKLLQGKTESIASGDLFEVSKWVVPDRYKLNVWIPVPKLSVQEIDAISKEFEKLAKKRKAQMVADPAASDVTHLISWEKRSNDNESSKEGWWLFIKNKEPLFLGSATDQVTKHLQSVDGQPIRLFVNLPPPSNLIEKIQIGEGTQNNSVRIVNSAEEAHYHLMGRKSGSRTEYAWVLAGVFQDKKRLDDSAMPVRTGFEDAASVDSAAKTLEENVLRLSKLRSWLMIAPQAEEGNFPYRLVLKNSSSGEIVSLQTESSSTRESGVADGNVVVTPQISRGQEFGLALVAEREKLKDVVQRFVYVFSIDSWGNGTLLFPLEEYGGVENRFPVERIPPSEIPLAKGQALFTVGDPLGVDTYILLASAQPINPSVLEFQGVLRGATRGGSRGSENPLQFLFDDIGHTTRGTTRVVPSDWYIDRLVVKSVESTPTLNQQ